MWGLKNEKKHVFGYNLFFPSPSAIIVAVSEYRCLEHICLICTRGIFLCVTNTTHLIIFLISIVDFRFLRAVEQMALLPRNLIRNAGLCFLGVRGVPSLSKPLVGTWHPSSSKGSIFADLSTVFKSPPQIGHAFSHHFHQSAR